MLDTIIKKQTKSLIRKCCGCHKHRILPFSRPKPGSLPTAGTDYSGFIYHRIKPKKESKANIFIFTVFTCSMSSARYTWSC